MDAATKKLFAVVNELEKKLTRLDELEQRLTALDTNGRLDGVREEMEQIKKSMASVAADSRVVVSTVESHGSTIQKLENTLTRLNLRCPLLKPSTEELPKVVEREALKNK